MKEFYDDIKHWVDYDYVVINDDLNECYEEISEVINKYINCKNGDNIEFKEQYYSELTFHYWFWKNKLAEYSDDIWIGFCQKRRFWLNSKDVNRNENISNILLF